MDPSTMYSPWFKKLLPWFIIDAYEKLSFAQIRKVYEVLEENSCRNTRVYNLLAILISKATKDYQYNASFKNNRPLMWKVSFIVQYVNCLFWKFFKATLYILEGMLLFLFYQIWVPKHLYIWNYIILLKKNIFSTN